MATVNPAGISPSGRGAVGGIENGAMGGFDEKKEPLDNFYSCEENNYSTLDEMKMKQDKHSMPVHRNVSRKCLLVNCSSYCNSIIYDNIMLLCETGSVHPCNVDKIIALSKRIGDTNAS